MRIHLCAGALLTCLLLLGSRAPLVAQPGAAPVRLPKNALKNLDADIERLRRMWEVPGLAVAIVTPDRVVYVRGFGSRNVAHGLGVTANTLFGIASCSKSIGAASVCLLAQEGRLNLDAPVQEAWPGFQLADAYASQHVTPRDLLTHRWGVPRHDLVWYHAPAVPRRELLRRLRYLPAADEPRATFHYSNLGYAALSQLVQEVNPDHATWEAVTRRRILFPLGMTRTNFSVHDSEKDADHAIPYRFRATAPPADAPTGKKATKPRASGGTTPAEAPPLEALPLEDVDAVGAAANINSSATDMAKWLRATLTDGRPDGVSLISAEALHATHEPQMAYDLPAPDEDVYTDTYGMGWVIGSYRGYRFMTHSGSLDGFTSEMAVLPNEGIGVVVLANLDDTELPHLLANTLLDRLTGLPAIDWSARYQEYQQDEAAATAEEDSLSDPFRVADTRPSHPLAAYAGYYQHPAYGTLRLRAAPDGHLRGDLHGLGLALTHYHYETFATDASQFLPTIGPEATGPARAESKNGPAPSAVPNSPSAAKSAATTATSAPAAPLDPVPIGGLRFTFATDARGDISAVSAPLEPDAREPITFERLPDTVRLTRAQLLPFVGIYGPSPRESFRVELAPSFDSLRVAFPGQPAQMLVPVRATEFVIPASPGYLLRFVVPAGAPPATPATEVLTIQPEGVFRDRRRQEE